MCLTRIRYHLGNPYWKTFDPYINPLLTKPIDLHRYNEIDSAEPVTVDKDEDLWGRVRKYQQEEGGS